MACILESMWLHVEDRIYMNHPRYKLCHGFGNICSFLRNMSLVLQNFLKNKAWSTAGEKWDQNSWKTQASKAELENFLLPDWKKVARKNSLYYPQHLTAQQNIFLVQRQLNLLQTKSIQFYQGAWNFLLCLEILSISASCFAKASQSWLLKCMQKCDKFQITTIMVCLWVWYPLY